MKARKEDNGQIRIYGNPPSKWKGVTGNYAGGFHLIDEETLKEEGFFEVVTPEYNRNIEVLSEIYFDEENQIYTYDVLPNPNLPTIEEAKISKIKELKHRAKEKFNETDWYYIREIHAGKNGKNKKVPDLIIEEREEIYGFIELKEAEIDSLVDLEDVLNFNISLEGTIPMEGKIVEEPIIEEPVVEEKVIEEPLVEEKEIEETLVEESVVDVPVVEEPVTEEPTVEVPIAELPIVEEPIVETPVEESVTVVPIIDEPIVEKPATIPIPDIFLEDPIIEEPIVETPVEETVVEPPVSNSTPIPEPPLEEAELNQFTV
jgi:hypothetical protein